MKCNYFILGKRCHDQQIRHTNVSVLAGRYADSGYIQCDAGYLGPTGVHREVVSVQCLQDGTWSRTEFCNGTNLFMITKYIKCFFSSIFRMQDCNVYVKDLQH